ncbi:NF-X1-type zinc finger protein nfxl2, partial [Sarracenia purpurea var. burkii]
TPGLPCPPCPELVWRSCVGEHIGAERMMVCSAEAEFSCNNLCGNLLRCGNHYCTKTCHALKSRSSFLGQRERAEPCEYCDLPCQKERQPICPHSCPMPCHPGECPPCKILIKRSCHCGSMVHVFECLYYNSMPEKEQMIARSCGGPCHSPIGPVSAVVEDLWWSCRIAGPMTYVVERRGFLASDSNEIYPCGVDMQKVTQLYTSMPRDMSSRSMPCT